MVALADMTPKELRDRKRALEARIARRRGAIIRAKADQEEARLILQPVQLEIDRRAKLAKGNQAKR